MIRLREAHASLSSLLPVLASAPAFYHRDVPWSAKGTTGASRYTLLSPSRMAVNIDQWGYALETQREISLASAASWDSVTPTDYTVADNRAGKDFYVYACIPATGQVPDLILSANSTCPSGYTADNSRKIGGFHCLCLGTGINTPGVTAALPVGHPVKDYDTGDILPTSIWDLIHRARNQRNEGMYWDEQTALWWDIYMMSGTGGASGSVFGGTITDTRSQTDFVDDLAAVGKQIPSDEEFQVAARGSNEETNIAGSADPVTTGGHVDTAGRRMISHGGGEDFCGAMWQWLRTQSFRFDEDIVATFTTAAKTLTAYHAASPGGNPIYLKYDASGFPYLCCNMATDAVDKILTFGSSFTLRIKHDADAATGSYQIYFDEDATQPARLLCALPGQKAEYLKTSAPNVWLSITYNAAPGTPGVALYFDDGSDERIEFTSPTAANGTLDTCYIASPAWGYYDLPGSKGSLYKQGAYGDIKLLAGGSWGDGSYCGSRARSAFAPRWRAYSNFGGRGRAEPL